jgi:hypothetical protein
MSNMSNGSCHLSKLVFCSCFATILNEKNEPFCNSKIKQFVFPVKPLKKDEWEIFASIWQPFPVREKQS